LCHYSSFGGATCGTSASSSRLGIDICAPGRVTHSVAAWITKSSGWFALLSEKQIKRGTHRSTIELEQAIRHYLAVYNANPTPFMWTKTADEILASLARFCKRISDSGH
jgi:hypothetical protein